MVANVSWTSTMCKALDQTLYFEDGEKFCPRMDHAQRFLISTLDDLADEIWDF